MSDAVRDNSFSSGWMSALGVLGFFQGRRDTGSLASDAADLQDDARMIDGDAQEAFRQFQGIDV